MSLRTTLMSSLVLFVGCTATDHRKAGPTVDDRVAFRRASASWVGGFHGFQSEVSDRGEIAFTPKVIAPSVTQRGRGARSERTQVIGARARLHTTSIRRGEQALDEGTPAAREVGGKMIVQRGAVREVIANTDRGVETQWEFDREPAGGDDLVVRVGVSNARWIETSARGLAFADDKGVGFTYGHATWVSGDGAKTPVSTRWSGDAIEMRVPRAVLEKSEYPAVLDPLAVPSAHPTTSTYTPAVAAIGATNLVVWESYLTNNPRLTFSFVSDTDGQVSAAVHDRNVSTNEWQQDPVAAPAGTSFVVAWSDKRGGVNNIRIARIDATTGDVSNEIAVATTTNEQYRPGVNCMSATSCLVTWNEYTPTVSEVKSSLVNPSAGSAGAPQTVSATQTYDQYGAVTANDGVSYFVAWQADLSASDADVVGRIVNASGVPQGSAAAVTTTTDAQYTPSVAFNGTNYVVGYTEWNGTNEDALARFVATSGSPTGSPFTLANGAGDQTAPFVAKSGTSVLAVWSQAGDIHARSLASDGTLGTAFPISTATNTQELPSVTQGTGTNLYVVYADRQTGTYAVTGTRATLSEIVPPTIVVPAGPLLCDKVTLDAKPASPQAVGTKVELKAKATCATGATPEYEFAVDSGSGFKVIRPFGAAETFSWDTSSSAAGTQQVRVNARREGSTVPEEASETIPYTLTGGTVDGGTQPGSDAGAGIDAGTPTTSPGSSSSGCSCTTAGRNDPTSHGPLVLLGGLAGAVIALSRRRRR